MLFVKSQQIKEKLKNENYTKALKFPKYCFKNQTYNLNILKSY